jgi:flagellar basal body rod protein FlgC
MRVFSSLSVSASGMNAQRTRAELLVENLAKLKRRARRLSPLNTVDPIKSVQESKGEGFAPY